MTWLRSIGLVALILSLLSTFVEAGPVMINQVGYLPDAQKIVITSGITDSFSVVEEQNGTVVFQSDFTAYTSIDPGAGITANIGDFSSLNTPGTYRIITSADDTSAIFTIAESVYFPVYESALKGFYYQRCGTALTEPFAGEYTHGSCHPMDGVLHVSTDTAGFLQAPGGWHDAGDFGKYVVNAGVTTGTMLMAYEYYPYRFYADDLGIPESGNGIPDVLDELRYELEWLLSMQNTDGGVFHKLTSKQFAGEVMPEDHDDTRYVYEISSAATADFAAVMARAARVFEPWDLQFAQLMFIAARQAWNYLEAHPDIVPTGGFHNPDDTGTGEYGDGDDRGERLWAAAELYAATGEAEYRTYFENYYENIAFSPGFGWSSVGTLAHLTFLFSEYTDPESVLGSELTSAFQDACDTIVSIRNQSQFGTAIQPGEYVWGSNSVALNRGIMLALGFRQFADSSYYNTAIDQLHYVLGKNIHNMSFVTGIGNHSPQNIHHRPSQADDIPEPVPGLLAGGPNEYLSDPSLQSHFDDSTPPAECYLDVWGSYASNEIAINWNAPLVFLSGYFTVPDSAQTDFEDDGHSYIPNRIELKQNYPNPFNGDTRFAFTLNSPQKVTLVVYDLRGQVVDKKSLGMMNPGQHTYHWDTERGENSTLSSGMYLARLEGEFRSEMRKLVLLK